MTLTDRIARVGYSKDKSDVPPARGNRIPNGRDYRTWAILPAALALAGFLICHLIGAPQAMAVFAAIDALTWGQALAAIVPTDDGIEFVTIAVATSAAVLILVGMLLVEVHLTGTFLWVFIGIGAVSLSIQMVTWYARTVSLRARPVLPQRVPSIINGKIILEDR